ncbi:MAG: hypothetical protein ACP5U0_08075 [Caldisphaera sp.]
MAEISNTISNDFNMEAFEYIGGAILGGLTAKYIPTNMSMNLGSYLTLGVGVFYGVLAIIIPDHKSLKRILVGAALFDIIDGIFRVFIPSLAL